MWGSVIPAHPGFKRTGVGPAWIKRQHVLEEMAQGMSRKLRAEIMSKNLGKLIKRKIMGRLLWGKIILEKVTGSARWDYLEAPAGQDCRKSSYMYTCIHVVYDYVLRGMVGHGNIKRGILPRGTGRARRMARVGGRRMRRGATQHLSRTWSSIHWDAEVGREDLEKSLTMDSAHRNDGGVKPVDLEGCVWSRCNGRVGSPEQIHIRLEVWFSWWILAPAEHVEGETSEVEHEAGHQDSVEGGQDAAHQVKAGGGGEACVNQVNKMNTNAKRRKERNSRDTSLLWATFCGLLGTQWHVQRCPGIWTVSQMCSTYSAIFQDG